MVHRVACAWCTRGVCMCMCVACAWHVHGLPCLEPTVRMHLAQLGTDASRRQPGSGKDVRWPTLGQADGTVAAR